MKIKEYFKNIIKKSENNTITTGRDIVLSTRVRYARNMANRPFPWRASDSVLQEIWDSVSDTVLKYDEFNKGVSFYLSDLATTERKMLVERHLISYDLANARHPRGIIVDEEENASLMINEEDHLRISVKKDGLDLSFALHLANEIDKKLSKEMKFAFNDQWGYLTTCPTNIGTGMRVSCLLHLPALMLTQNITPMLSELSKIGITARGFYGEGTKVIGDMFQISNATTLGKSEEDIEDNLEHVISSVVNYEKHMEKELLAGKNKIKTEDKIYRSVALLGSSRSIEFHEAMSYISKARLGLRMGYDLGINTAKLNSLMMLIQPAHIQMLVEKNIDAEERDVVRASLIRKEIII